MYHSLMVRSYRLNNLTSKTCQWSTQVLLFSVHALYVTEFPCKPFIHWFFFILLNPVVVVYVRKATLVCNARIPLFLHLLSFQVLHSDFNGCCISYCSHFFSLFTRDKLVCVPATTAKQKKSNTCSSNFSEGKSFGKLLIDNPAL